MPTKIPQNFKPDERSYNNLRKHGAIPEFVDDQLPEFITYWEETGKKKASWQMTLQTWMRRAWKGKAGKDWEYQRHQREKYYGKPRQDIFDSLFSDIKNNLDRKPDKALETHSVTPRIIHTAIPGEGEPMKPEEAFEQLRQSGVIK